MDIKREAPKSKKKYILAGVGVAAVVVVTALLAQLKPAAPSVDVGTLLIDSVVRGPLVREVRGPGSLTPEVLQYITAVTAGRVEKRHLRPPAVVTAESIILELTNPDVEIQVLNADRQLADAEANLVSLRTNLRTSHLNQASVVEDVRQQAQDAKRRAEAGNELLKKGLIIPLDQQQAADRAKALETRLAYEEQRLQLLKDTIEEQIKAQEAAGQPAHVDLPVPAPAQVVDGRPGRHRRDSPGNAAGNRAVRPARRAPGPGHPDPDAAQGRVAHS